MYCQPDRPSGRGRKLKPGPVKACALEHGIPVRQPTSLRDPDVQRELAELQADVMVVVAYGLLLPPAVLIMPTLGCLNIHGSLLPRWRGAAPLHRAILAGDDTTGITIMLMDEGLDTGPMLSRMSVPVHPSTTTATLHDQLADIGAHLLLTTLQDWCEGNITAREQDAGLATYAAKLEKTEAVIDWQQSAIEIDRQVRAFNPWPVAETTLNGERLRVWCSRIDSDSALPASDRPAGSVVQSDRSGIRVQCGTGTLVIEELQLPGKRSMSAADFVNANDVSAAMLGASASSTGND